MVSFNMSWTTLLVQPWWVLSLCYPLVYIALLNATENRRWGAVLHPPFPYLLRTFLYSLFVGSALSMLFSFFSVTFPFSLYECYLIWIVTLVLSLAGIRFACISYAVAICGLLHLLVQQLAMVPALDSWLHPWWKSLYAFSLRDWLWLVALLHLCEAFLIRADGGSGKQIIERQHDDEQIVNGFCLAKVWPIPLLLPTPMGLLPFSLLLGFAELNLSRPVRQQLRLSGTLLFLYAMCLIFLLMLSSLYAQFNYIALLFSLLGHEGVYQWRRIKEQKARPLFVSTEKGLRILEVLPCSPADDMGMRSGDVLFRLNGKAIRSIEDVTEITPKSAYCKLEIIDDQSDNHYLQRPLFENDPLHLGIIGAVSNQTSARLIDPREESTSMAIVPFSE